MTLACLEGGGIEEGGRGVRDTKKLLTEIDELRGELLFMNEREKARDTHLEESERARVQAMDDLSQVDLS